MLVELKTLGSVCWEVIGGGCKKKPIQKSLNVELCLASEEQINSYVDQCTFKFKEIEDSEERIRLEHFATAVLAPKLDIIF